MRQPRFLRADDGNRTRDLRTTNATHYRLCYISICCLTGFNQALIDYHHQAALSTKKAESFSAGICGTFPVCQKLMELLITVAAPPEKPASIPITAIAMAITESR